MSGETIGNGDAQSHILSGDRTEGTGYGDKPSLPQHLRNFDPLMGSAREGEVLPGGSHPLTLYEANLVNAHHGLVRANPLPPSEEEDGAFIACTDMRRNPEFSRWLVGDASRNVILRTLMQATTRHSDLGIGLVDISRIFGSPGANNVDLVPVLIRWCRHHPRVRALLDGIVADLRAQGRIPHADGTIKVTT